MAPPGMLYGRIARPAAPGARLASLDDTAARGCAGVEAVVRDGSFIGVIASREEAAVKAVALLQKGAVWTAGVALPPPDDLFGWMRAQPVDTTVIEDKKPEAAVAVARTVSATFTKPYLAHASIAPSCAIAQWQDGKLLIWSHSQGIYNLRTDLALALGMAAADITIEHVEGAGCYGHNGADDVALDAALLARAVPGRPVQVVWSREEELAWSPHGPAMQIDITAGLDAAGDIVSWEYDVRSNGHGIRPGRAKIPTLLAARYLEQPFEQYIAVNAPLANGGGSDRNAIAYYDFPQHTVRNHRLLTMPVRVSAMRALGGYANIFAIESFIDQLAREQGIDPVAYRLRYMRDERAIAVLQNAAASAGWDAWEKAPHEEGVGHGIAWVRYKNTGAYCAVVAEVEVAEIVRVKRLVIAVDVGLVINPDGVINQIEGGAVQATSWTLKEAVAFDTKRVNAVDWESYPIINFSEAPAVEVEIINRTDMRSVGAGEAAQGPTAAAIANAVQNAMGVRVRDLPITPERIVAAM
jgi:CO/xanthine dehydrogenase Mo-binding subunit